MFALVDTLVAAIAVAESYCWESPKPTEFGTTGEYWDNVGWKVLVQLGAVHVPAGQIAVPIFVLRWRLPLSTYLRRVRPTRRGKSLILWCARRDSNSRPTGSKVVGVPSILVTLVYYQRLSCALRRDETTVDSRRRTALLPRLLPNSMGVWR